MINYKASGTRLLKTFMSFGLPWLLFWRINAMKLKTVLKSPWLWLIALTTLVLIAEVALVGYRFSFLQIALRFMVVIMLQISGHLYLRFIEKSLTQTIENDKKKTAIPLAAWFKYALLYGIIPGAGTGLYFTLMAFSVAGIPINIPMPFARLGPMVGKIMLCIGALGFCFGNIMFFALKHWNKKARSGGLTA
jgi:hypothetical protein